MRLAERVGVADRIEFLGALPRSHVPPLLRSADVVACCPWYEPFGMVAVEAMACGRPVVATAQGQFLDQAEAGLLRVAAPGDPEELRRVIIDLLDDREAATTMGKAARADLEVNHTDTGWMRAIAAAARAGGVTVNEPAPLIA